MSLHFNEASNHSPHVAIIGAGPAGLMAAEIIAKAGYTVDIYDAKPSAARKFLLAGVGGMNITHSEEWGHFLKRYYKPHPYLLNALNEFNATQLREWLHDLGIPTFIGSSGKVFPDQMKAAPLLRAWLHRLRTLGVTFHMRHKCIAISKDSITFTHNDNIIEKKYSSIVLALGGASWPSLGSDGQWQQWLANHEIGILPLYASNCGFNIGWSEYFKNKFAGMPLKNVHLSFIDLEHHEIKKQGECMMTEYGIEGSAIYALSSALQDSLKMNAQTQFFIDLIPNKTEQQLEELLNKKSNSVSFSTWLKKVGHLNSCEIALYHEFADKTASPALVASQIKKLAIPILSARPIQEAISSGGGIQFDNLTSMLMLKQLPGIFCAGEMLDWDAPTGGYLLTACFATGRKAGLGVIEHLNKVY